MTTTTAKHTPGALRAAGEIAGDFYSLNIERMAAIIDRETGVAEMLKALEWLYRDWQVLACQCIGSDEMNAGHKNCIVGKGLRYVEAAIKKAKGEL